MLFRKNIDPRCAYCAKGSRINDEQVVCVRRGVVPASDHCGAFSYDPLKRVPPRPMKLDATRLTEDDFKL